MPASVYLIFLYPCLPVWGYSIAFSQRKFQLLESYEKHGSLPLPWKRLDNTNAFGHLFLAQSRRKNYRVRAAHSDKGSLDLDRASSNFPAEKRNLLIGLASIIIISSLGLAMMFKMNDLR
jgi:hypothetical protein